MHYYQNETGSQVIPLASPQTVQFSTSNHTQDTIPACIVCGSTAIRFIEFDFGRSSETGYSDSGAGWECDRGHLEAEVEDQIVMPAYVIAALDELADASGPYDWPGDTMRDEGRAA